MRRKFRTAVTTMAAATLVATGASTLASEPGADDNHASKASATTALSGATADITAARDSRASESSRSVAARKAVSQALPEALGDKQAEWKAQAEKEAQERAAREAAERQAAEEAARQKAAEEEAARQKAAEEEAARQQAAEAEARKRAPWVSPVSGYRISAGFGKSGKRWASTHSGLDFAAEKGTKVRAIGDGKVIFAGWDGAYGNKIAIRHTDGTVTWYAHLSKFAVKTGEKVDKDQAIGRVGSTGNSTGPHLHLEVRPGNGGPVDPHGWLSDHGVNV